MSMEFKHITVTPGGNDGEADRLTELMGLGWEIHDKTMLSGHSGSNYSEPLPNLQATVTNSSRIFYVLKREEHYGKACQNYSHQIHGPGNCTDRVDWECTPYEGGDPVVQPGGEQ